MMLHLHFFFFSILNFCLLASVEYTQKVFNVESRENRFPNARKSLFLCSLRVSICLGRCSLYYWVEFVAPHLRMLLPKHSQCVENEKQKSIGFERERAIKISKHDIIPVLNSLEATNYCKSVNAHTKEVSSNKLAWTACNFCLIQMHSGRMGHFFGHTFSCRKVLIFPIFL